MGGRGEKKGGKGKGKVGMGTDCTGGGGGLLFASLSLSRSHTLGSALLCLPTLSLSFSLAGPLCV